MEITIGDNIGAYSTISHSLPELQGRIITAMSYCSDLVQVYSHSQRKSSWEMTGSYGAVSHASSVKALIRKKLIVPIISDKEWEVQIALGTAEERMWKLNDAVLELLQNAICLIRSVREDLKEGKAPTCLTKSPGT